MRVEVVWILALLIAYLLGSIPTGYLLVRSFRGQDVRTQGSGNIGATNVARSGGARLGVLTLLVDLLKGFVAVAVARALARHVGFPVFYDIAAMAGLFAVVGHCFPVWLRFRGGKGVATALGVFIALAPLAAVGCVVVFAVVFAITRRVSAGSLAGAVCWIPFSILPDSRHRALVYLADVLISVIVIAKHRSNIQRLMAGTEPRFGAEKRAKA